MSSSALPNMGIKYPITGDNDYNTTIQDSITLIDAHDHTTSKGVQIPTAGIANLAVTPAKRSALNIQVSSSCGDFNTTSTTPVSVTNLSVTIAGLLTTRPVQVMIQPDLNGSNNSYIRVESTDSVNNVFTASGTLQIFKDAAMIIEMPITQVNDDSGSNRTALNIPLFSFIDPTPGAASVTYSVKAVTYQYNKISVKYMKLVAYEI